MSPCSQIQLIPRFSAAANIDCGATNPHTCRFGFCAKQEPLPTAPPPVGPVQTRARRASVRTAKGTQFRSKLFRRGSRTSNCAAVSRMVRSRTPMQWRQPNAAPGKPASPTKWRWIRKCPLWTTGRLAMPSLIKGAKRRPSRRRGLAGRSLFRRLGQDLQPIIPPAASPTLSRRLLSSIASAFRGR